MNVKDVTFKSVTKSVSNAVTDVLTGSDFISRTIGMNNSYEDIMFIVQALGREPVSLLGKNYAFIFDHVRRNYMQGKDISSTVFEEVGCKKFTFYKDPPTVRFADPMNDPMNLLERWKPNMDFQYTSAYDKTIHYSESSAGQTNNHKIDSLHANEGTNYGYVESYGPTPTLKTCDLVSKTNANFNHGKYETLVARFHTNGGLSDIDLSDSTQTAFSKQFGQSHGRNLLKRTPDNPNGYHNPYCRVWTYHHQYSQVKDQMRPLKGGDVDSQEELEVQEGFGGFRTLSNSGSTRLDKHGVLNYKNGTVNIAPTAKITDYFEEKTEEGYKNNIISPKKCMFSIENLAWKDDKSRRNEFDAYGLSAEQKGPLGGRIMWFPPYNLKFNESVNVNWNSNEFIGRGEKIYTYTNTERRGNLSFTLLIDHPSVLDYWTGHERNGMKNKNIDLKKGNIGGVDEIDNQENTLLRFFAGCEVLTVKPHVYKMAKIKPEIVPEPKLPPEPTPPPPTKEVNKTFCAVLYYPNNYCGKDDFNNNKVNPIWYLMNGVGAQKYIDENGKLQDIPTVITEKLTNGVNNGGYEIYKGDNGISQVTNVLNENLATCTSTFVDSTKAGDSPQYLTKEDGTKVTVKYGSNEYTLAKIVGKGALVASQATTKNLSGIKAQWNFKRYYYRCDKDKEIQNLQKVSYIDGKSFGLNHDGFTNVRNEDEKWGNPVKGFDIKKDDDNYTLMSFTDLFAAVENNKDSVVPYNKKENVEVIKDILENKDKYSKIKITIQGHASWQGQKSKNEQLAKERAETVRNWLKKSGRVDGIEIEIKKGVIQDVPPNQKSTLAVGGVDKESSKIWRSASIMVEFSKTETVDASDAPTKTSGKKDANEEVVSETKINVKSEKQSNSTIPFNDTNNSTDIVEETEDSKTSTVKRYDNEGEFFEALDKESPFLHNLISEKIKYFDPAFHSVSPEGFNARLTFLHQCTRQGSTVGNADGSVATTAYNMAFGRPPVCVLRIGDFYYTKIVINSININYDSPQWDMNQEGIGMMPMFADITIDFAFIGGSDIAGPIARLQNAVSFNYYANTSTYDNRSEIVEYNPNGNGREIFFKGFTYPNMYSGDRKNMDNLGEDF